MSSGSDLSDAAGSDELGVLTVVSDEVGVSGSSDSASGCDSESESIGLSFTVVEFGLAGPASVVLGPRHDVARNPTTTTHRK